MLSIFLLGCAEMINIELIVWICTHEGQDACPAPIPRVEVVPSRKVRMELGSGC